MNKVMITGRLADDPMLNYTSNGNAVCNFTLAVERTYSKKNKVDWINVVAWNKKGEAAAKHLKKGRKCLVEGRLEINKTKKDGNHYTNVDVVAGYIEFLSAPQQAEKDNRESSSGKQGSSMAKDKNATTRPSEPSMDEPPF